MDSGVSVPPRFLKTWPEIASTDNISLNKTGQVKEWLETPVKVSETIVTRSPPRNADGQMCCDHPVCLNRGITFIRVVEWNRHVDKHHERPYKCRATGCELRPGFSFLRELLRHERVVHNKNSFYFCPFPDCNRSSGIGFTRIDNLEVHKRRRHAVETDGDLTRSSHDSPTSTNFFTERLESLKRKRVSTPDPHDDEDQRVHLPQIRRRPNSDISHGQGVCTAHVVARRPSSFIGFPATPDNIEVLRRIGEFCEGETSQNPPQFPLPPATTPPGSSHSTYSVQYQDLDRVRRALFSTDSRSD